MQEKETSTYGSKTAKNKLAKKPLPEMNVKKQCKITQLSQKECLV